MTTVRDVVDTPGMPGWVRLALAVMAVAFLGLGAAFARPVIDAGWTWGQGLLALLTVAIGIDLLHAAARKRWPLVLFADLLLPRLMTRKRR